MYVFKRSLSDITYYREIIKTNFFFSLKYLYMLLVALLFIQGLLFAISAFTFLPKAPDFIKTARSRLTQAYPTELTVKVAKGEVTTNVKEPYFIDIPELKDNETGFKHLITIDTQATIDDYKSYDSLVLVTKKAIVYPDRNRGDLSSYTVTYLEDAKDVTINKALYDSLVNKILPFLDMLPTILIVLAVLGIVLFPILFGVLMLIWKLLFLAIMSLILWLISNIFKNDLKYDKIFQLGMHGLTLPILLTFLLELFSIHIPNLYTVGFLLWMVIILAKIKPAVHVKHST